MNVHIPFPGRSSLFRTILVFAVTLSAALAVMAVSENRRMAAEKELTLQIGLNHAGKIQQTLNSLLYTTRSAELLVREGHGSIKDFDSRMKDIIGDYPIRNISLAPGGIVTQVYPYSGNENAIGHDLLNDPKRALESVAAINSGTLTLSGPYELRQGGLGIIGRVPVSLKDERGRDYFWGLICVVLDIPQALYGAQMQNLEDMGMAYELWRINPDDNSHQTIMGSALPLQASPQTVPFALPNSQWNLSLTPAKGWFNLYQVLLKSSMALLFSLLAALLYKNDLELRQNRDELAFGIRQQTANYQTMNQINEELHVFRHDIQNHLLSLSTLMENQDLKGASAYLSTISGELTATKRIINTENYVFDALLAEKTEKARSKEIQVESEIQISRPLNIHNMDWSTLFGNSLDNAIEACERLGDSPKKILIKAQCSTTIFHARISNTSPPPNQTGHRLMSSKEDRARHGIGMAQIQKVVKKYDGVIEAKFENGIFTLSFTLFNV